MAVDVQLIERAISDVAINFFLVGLLTSFILFFFVIRRSGDDQIIWRTISFLKGRKNVDENIIVSPLIIISFILTTIFMFFQLSLCSYLDNMKDDNLFDAANGVLVVFILMMIMVFNWVQAHRGPLSEQLRINTSTNFFISKLSKILFIIFYLVFLSFIKEDSEKIIAIKLVLHIILFFDIVILIGVHNFFYKKWSERIKQTNDIVIHSSESNDGITSILRYTLIWTLVNWPLVYIFKIMGLNTEMRFFLLIGIILFLQLLLFYIGKASYLARRELIGRSLNNNLNILTWMIVLASTYILIAF